MNNGFKDPKGNFRPTGPTKLNGKTFSAYDVKAKTETIIVNPHLTKLRNGRPAIQGDSKITGIVVHKIISKSEADALKSK